MLLENVRVGLAITGSFCTLNSFFPVVSELMEEGAKVTPVFSHAVNTIPSRFSTAESRMQTIESLTGVKAMTTIEEAEHIGPKDMFDILAVAPCTGNTLAKLVYGITDTPVTMAVKAHLRNNKPVVIGISTNDGLGANAKNIGMLLNTKHFYFVPFGQDDPEKKEKSIVFKNDQFIQTLLKALEGKQLQPLLA